MHHHTIRIALSMISAVFLFIIISSLPISAPAAEPAAQVILETDLGAITLELDRDKAPRTVDNFIQYVQDGYYNGTIFHRVIPDFMIQGGGLTADMQAKQPRPPILNEADNGLTNLRGTIAMARTAEPDSATCQFFINHKDNPRLNHRGKNPVEWGYCVFGRVIKGMEVVDAIAAQPTHTVDSWQNVPVKPIVIKKAALPRPAAP
ncbi:MAG: peptidylprolyl isomerase [Thermodesulfobacteriota bacterium]